MSEDQTWWEWATTPWTEMPGSSVTVDPRDNEDTTLSQSEYDFTYKVFPNDLGMDYMGHYMIINVNVPVFPGTSTPRGSDTITNQFKVLPNEFSKVDVLRFGKNATAGKDTQAFVGALPRRTRRIAQSIALYMPGSQLVFGTQNEYSEISMTAIGGKIITGTASTAIGLFSALKSGLVGGGSGAIDAVSSVVDGLGNAVTTGAKLVGTPINPAVEVMFSATKLRDFTFDFILIPRNQKESETIREIVKTLRFHAAPEIAPTGFTLIPPADFDITFFHRGVENKAIPRINTCVLVGMEVDYSSAVNGQWTTFRDGYPTAVMMRLQFQEVEAMHKARVLQNF
jgi:hypothetical protein